MKRRTGFTLIELLVVIAIIAVLMSILMPALQRVKKQAQGALCMSRLRQWGQFFAMYTGDNDGFFNEGWGYQQHYGNGVSSTAGLWPVKFKSYYKDQTELLLCPLAVKPWNQTQWGPFVSFDRTMQYPNGRNLEAVFSFNINSWTNHMKGPRGDRPLEWFWRNVNTFKGQNNVPVFGDGMWHDAWPRHTDSPPVSDGAYANTRGGGTSNEMHQFCINRHLNGKNDMLFSDWSVRSITLKELWRLKWHRQYDTGVQPAWPAWMNQLAGD